MPEQPTFLYDIFISYSHSDRDWVSTELLPRLEQAGLKVCVDYRDFHIGVPSLINMERAVDNSRHTLAVMTPRYLLSEWCEFEALLVGVNDPAGRRRKLFPLVIETCAIPTRLSLLTYADFTVADERDRQFERLLGQLRSMLPPAPTVIEAPSPFIAGPPITQPRHFFGHERMLKRLFNLLKRRPLQNAAVIGPRRSGKTSLLLHLRSLTQAAAHAPEQLRPDQRADWLPQPESYRWVFVDFQDPRLATQSALLGYLAGQLGLPASAPHELEGFIEAASRHVRTPTVILLDEIDVALQRYEDLDEPFWEGLRALATTQVEGNLAFVMAASELPTEVARHQGIGSPFFNIFAYTADLAPLTEAEATTLIASSPIPFPDTDVEWILAQSGRWPLLLQILCRERLIALEENEAEDVWRAEGLRQLAPFRHLLA